MERAKLAAAQRACANCAPIIAVLKAQETTVDPIRVLNTLWRQCPEMRLNSRNDMIVTSAMKYEIMEEVLFRRIYEVRADEVQLRCVVPNVAAGRFDVPGLGPRPLGYREKLLLDYHHGPLGAHQGRDRTIESLERDFWWPGMYEDVRRWCRGCVQCRKERGASGVSAWQRTELYSRPFRVMQFDTITTRDVTRHAPGSNYVLTVVDCFSRWCWLIPIPDRTAPHIADGLMKVFLDFAGFPAVLLSDNAPEFVGEIVTAMNKVLEIKQVTGSAYHPQSQGMIESLHKTMNGIVRGLVQQDPASWEEKIPYAQCILRTNAMACLGGRSPYEVVLGLKPKFPQSLSTAAGTVQFETVGGYGEKVLRYFKETWAELERLQRNLQEQAENKQLGRLSAALEEGDVVTVMRPKTAGY